MAAKTWSVEVLGPGSGTCACKSLSKSLSRLKKRATEAGVRDEKAFVEPEGMFVRVITRLANPDAPPDIDGTVLHHGSNSALEEQLASAYGAMLALIGADDEQTSEELAHMRKALPYVLASRGRSAPPVGDGPVTAPPPVGDDPVTAAALFQPEDASTDIPTHPTTHPPSRPAS